MLAVDVSYSAPACHEQEACHLPLMNATAVYSLAILGAADFDTAYASIS